ncbi:helix-turn-helix domain-containing protein [Corynebacterium suedekumii]|uniref:Helix-turn-helix transcriptional regulator n=1 Tax=Corynebacterium suedekumii TaxID=3049801 RepID=A0ABY8VPK8_9CORY|nr:helix-turn-helix transcriptional regulator [Corynebacterium suedekumii]WIM71443.1 helix-turn-helix transcriptional regulator [Corynebacterium suedekumii]
MRRGNESGSWPSYGHRLGANLRDLREMRGLTQEQLAEMVGMARNTISNIERNENNNGSPADPRLSTIYRLAAALDVPPAVLLPAGDRRVADICVATGLGIQLEWPASEEDTQPFIAAAQWAYLDPDGPASPRPVVARETDGGGPTGEA